MSFSDMILNNKQTTNPVKTIVSSKKVVIYTSCLEYYRESYIEKQKDIEEKVCQKKLKSKHSYREVEKRNKFFNEYK